MKHKRFEENILVDEAYTNYGQVDKNADDKQGYGIAKHFAETLEYGDKKKWYQQMPEEPTGDSKPVSLEQVEELRKEANSALHGDTLAYETKSKKTSSSDHQWAKTLLNKGAIGDRVAAATILIQDNPVYNLTALRNLVNSVKPAKKKDGIIIIDALSELLVSDLLIPEVKLRTFEQHPLGRLDEMSSGNKQARRSILKLWYFEDQLKELYGSYVEALNKFAHDSVDANKEKAVSAMSYLLMRHPEREKMLLSNIINKMGDPSRAVCSKVIYHLCQLLYNHPNMKGVVLAEIEKMLFRSNISPRAQYYGICFLNQFYLGKDDALIADNLIRIYFSFFKASIKKGDIDSRLMSAILTGVQRARPFASASEHAPAHALALFRLVHLAAPGVAARALALLYHVGDDDRFYSALYRKLSNADIFNTAHAALLFSLVYKSLKRDKNTERVIAFIKRLLQLCCHLSQAHACGILFLISQVLKSGEKRECVRLLWTKREIKEEVKEELPDEEDNEDKEEEEVMESTEHAPAEVNDTLTSTVENGEEVKVETTRMDLLKGEKKDLLIDDDEEETYVDLKIDDEGNVRARKRRAGAVAGWHHARVPSQGAAGRDADEKELATSIQLKKTLNMDRVISEYNPLARNPCFAGASRSAYLELLPLSKHFHPTVRLFAEKLLNDQVIQYSGDPLKDFSGIRFLDRFVFKNPKKRTEQEVEGDVKKVKGSHPKFAVRKNYTPKGIRGVPVNSASYLNEEAKNIPVDERFLYDFLQRRRVTKEPGDDEDEDSDDESVNSEDFDRYLDTVTGASGPASDEELDYLAEVVATKQKKPKGKPDDEIGEDLGSDEDDDDEIDEAGEEVDDSDGELDISGDENEPDFPGDEDELRLEDSDEDDQIDVPGTKSSKGKGKLKLKLKGKDDLGSLFASAEEFSTLLEETATNKKQGSSQAVSNTDNSSTKQLAWEDKRDRWIKGYNKKVFGNKGNKNRKFKPRNENFNKNKKNFNKMADKKVGGKRKSNAAEGSGGKRKKFK